MLRLKACAALIFLGSAISVPGSAQAAGTIEGRWYTAGKRAIVTIEPCGKSICGRITRFIEPPKNGVTTDINNPDAKLRNRKLLGLAVLSGFTENAGKWRGTIYDPEAGKTYRSVVRKVGKDKLKVEGCILFLCRGETWTSAD